MRRSRQAARTALAALVLAIAGWAPTALAYDLQITDLSDATSDPTPAGGVVTYDYTIQNSAADTATGVIALFDIPAGTSVVGAPAFCAADAGTPTRIQCNVGTLVGTLGGGDPVSFQLRLSTAGMSPGSITVRSAIGRAPVPPASTPLSTLPLGDAFFAGDTNAGNNVSTQVTTLTTAGNLELTKTATPDPVVAGGEVTYTIQVRNLGPSVSTNFNVVDTLPSGATFVAGSASGAGWTFSGANGTHAGTLAVNAAATYTFRARVTATSGTLVNSATVNAVGTPDPIPANNTDDVGTAVVPGADLAIAKSVAPAPAISGQPVTFTITTRNNGPSPAANVSFTDTMPAGFLITGHSAPAGWSCAVTSGDTVIGCSRAANYPSGAAVDTFTVQALVPATGAGSSGDQTNTVTITSTTADPVPANNSASAQFTVLTDGADLQLTSKTKAPGVIAVWDGIGSDADSRMTSTINVRNLGPRPATGQVEVVDTLAEGEEFLSVSSAQWSCSATPYAAPPARQAVTCSLNAGSLPLAINANAPALTLITRAVAAGTLTNTACTGGSGGSREPLTGGGLDVDPNTSNDCTGAGVRTTTARADLSITKQTNGPGEADNTLPTTYTGMSYTLVVSNAGPDATAGVVVNDTAIPGWISGRTTITPTAPAGWTCNVNNASVTCRSGATVLAPGQSATITIDVAGALADSVGQNPTCNGLARTGAHCNTAGVGVDAAVVGSVGEVNASNNSAQDFVQVPRVANVQTTTKVITSGAVGQEGVNSTYRIDYRNAGPSTAAGVIFRDVITLPANDAGFVLVSANRTGGGTTACTVTAGAGVSMAAAAGGTSYSTPGASGTVTVTCAALNMTSGATQSLNLVLRPNNNPGGSAGREFTNVADFAFTGTARGTDASGDFEYNSVETAADDQKSATLTFSGNAVDLLTNKVDTGFAGGIDPLGFDPDNFANNAITYRVTVRNNGPSVANSVAITDTLTPPVGRTVRFVGASATPGGTYSASACTVGAGSNPTVGAPLTLQCPMPGAGFTPAVDGVVASGYTSTLYLRYQYETAPGAAGDTVQNTVVASSLESDTNPANNEEGESTTIRSRSDVRIAKRIVLATPAPSNDPTVALPAEVATVTIRQPFVYVLDGTNAGPGSSLSLDRSGTNPLNGIGTVITDTLPAGLVVTGPITWQKVGPNPGGDEVPSGTGTCTLVGSTVTCNLGDVTYVPGDQGRVRVLVPSRWDAIPAGGTANNTATIATQQVEQDPTNNTVTVPLAVTGSSLAGIVFNDRDRAGANGGTPQPAPGEPRLAGVTIALTGVDAYGNPVNLSTTTDANGAYRFDNLSPSDATGYTITQSQPAGYGNGPIDPPTSGADAPSLGGTYAAGTPNSTYTGIVVGGNAAGVRYNFPELRRASLSGFVYVDNDFNNVRNAGTDGPIAGTPVELLNAATGAVVATANTDANGFYQFSDLDPTIVYSLREVLPTGNYVNRPTAVNSGLIDGVACSTGCTPGTGVSPDAATTDRISTIDLGTGASGTEFNFGETPNGSSLAGRVWLDIDNDGVIDSGEAGIAGVTITLTGTDQDGSAVSRTTTTAADGRYSFTGLLPGSYVVTEPTQPTGTLNGRTVAGSVGGTATVPAVTPSSITAIAIGINQAAVDYNFGEIQPASLSGRVYFDHDDDGVIDTNENGIAGVTVTLTGTDVDGAAVSLGAITDANGAYAFSGLRPGTYTVTEPTQPAATTDGITTAGTVGGTTSGTATPKGTTPSAISGIVLPTGQSSIDNNFGEIADSPDLLVSKSASPATFTVGTESGYSIRVRNGGNAVTTGAYDVDDRLPDGVVLAGTPTGAGWSCTGAAGAATFRCTSTQVLAVGETHPGDIAVSVDVTAAAATSSSIVNAVIVRGGGETPAREPAADEQSDFDGNPPGLPACDPAITQNACRVATPVQASSAISGRVYFDNNANGVIDAADETGIPNVAVVLTGTDDLGRAVELTTTTDADGRYEFPTLRPGTYVVTEPTQPPGSTDGVTTPGTISGAPTGTATPQFTTPSAISGIVLPAGVQSIDNNFGEVADSPDLVVSKTADPVRFTTSNVARYTISVRNIGPKATSGEYSVEDRLPAGVTLAAAPTGTGWTCDGASGATRFTCSSNVVIASGTTRADRINVPVRVGASVASPVQNAVLVKGGGEDNAHRPTPTESAAFEGDVTQLPVCDPAITQNACRLPTPVQVAAAVSGTVWYDIGGDDTLLDGGDRRLDGWTVELVDPSTGEVVRTTTTGNDGRYRFADVVPGVRWTIRFRDPDTRAIWGLPVSGETAAGPAAPCDAAGAIAGGTQSSCRITEGGMTQLEVVLAPGEELPQQSLPVDPNGVVYDAVTRDPVPGSIVTLTPVGTCAGFDPRTSILNAVGGGYTIDGSSISMTVGGQGFYQFLFAPNAPNRCEYRLTVTPPAGYTFQSTLIPAETGTLSPPGAPGTTYAVQPNPTAPTAPVGTGTTYYLTLSTGSGTAGIVHNHIPLDPSVAPGLVITKTGDRRVAEVGDTVLYTITIRQTAGAAVRTVNVLDRLPPGFTYIAGTARANAASIADPLGQPGPALVFDVGPLAVGGQTVLTYRVRVGVGSQQGDGINRAQAFGCSITGGCVDPASLQPRPAVTPSNRAEYRVRVTGGVFTDETLVLGKIFVDCNNNQVQDREELGIPGVRLYFSDGTWMVSDAEGKYSHAGLPPISHTLKVDASTLPVGSRLVTSSNRNLGDADSLFLDLKNGELHRADFIEGSCSNPVLEQVKARRTQGEVSAPETEAGTQPLRFESKPVRSPQQGTDSANQHPIVDPRPTAPRAAANEEGRP
ncbi:MAG TPA: SdrD B-like domain-containing protein [Lysobacter sp.]|nr:SdrD B-like domain-containing protein [Lysobacter sp.]